MKKQEIQKPGYILIVNSNYEEKKDGIKEILSSGKCPCHKFDGKSHKTQKFKDGKTTYSNFNVLVEQKEALKQMEEKQLYKSGKKSDREMWVNAQKVYKSNMSKDPKEFPNMNYEKTGHPMDKTASKEKEKEAERTGTEV